MENSNSKSTGLKVALGILLALFLGTGFYTSKLYNDKKETESQEEIDVIIEFNVDENEIPYAEGNYQLFQKCISYKHDSAAMRVILMNVY